LGTPLLGVQATELCTPFLTQHTASQKLAQQHFLLSTLFPHPPILFPTQHSALSTQHLEKH
ncbi:hypothetical protein, partial [Geitlerinema calcuttense]